MPRAEYLVTSGSGTGTRLDLFLTERLPELTRSRIRKAIEEGGVKVDGTVRKPGYKLKADERIDVDWRDSEGSGVKPQDLPLKVIGCDDQIIVLDKPSGLVVHPGAGRREGTLASALIHHFPEVAAVGPRDRPGIVHRLDKETSGVMVVARTSSAFDSLRRQFEKRDVRKIYLGLVWGKMPSSEGRFAWPIGRHVRHGQRISVKTRHPREAETYYRVLRTFREMELLEIRPVTGRTHQIRVHLAASGHPVFGDAKYGRKGRKRGPAERLFLHAHKLSFLHPGTRERVEYASALPRELEECLLILGGGG